MVYSIYQNILNFLKNPYKNIMWDKKIISSKKFASVNQSQD